MTEEIQEDPTVDHKYLEDPESHGRERWPSRMAFYMAAVGSAVGFGNVWRFPSLAKDYGGGAFFIPYLLALFLVGLPVLILEIALGQYYQTGDVGVFGSFHARFRGVGMTSVASAYILVTYYTQLLAWVARAFFESFGSDDPWAKEGTTGDVAVGYFFDDIIGMSTLGEDLRPTRVVWPNVGYSLLCWIVIFLCLAFGLKWTGRIAYFTMGLPILLLFVFLIRACTLEGASDGIKEYIGIWDMSVLTDRGDVWSTAVSQIFFSLSVTMGTMTAYGSHCPRGEPAFLNSVVVGFSNSMFSFIAGFAVFASLGHLAHLEGVEVNDIAYSGFSLVFGTWPVVLGTLPGGEHWVRLLFFDLFLLGIDSAFSILEGPLTVCRDYRRIEPIAKWKVVIVFTFIGWLWGFLYSTDAGLIFLDVIDFYINFLLLLVGFFETFAAGWMFGLEEQVAQLGPAIVYGWMFTNFGSIILASGLWFGLEDNAVWGGFVGLFLGFLAGSGIILYLLKQKMEMEPGKWTWSTILHELLFRNVMELTKGLSEVVGYMPAIWSIGMKQLIPHILLILFINLASSDNGDGESLLGHYGSYVTWPFQVLGLIAVAFTFLLFLAGMAVPKIYEGGDRSAWGEVRHMHIYKEDINKMDEVEKDVEEPVEMEQAVEMGQ